ncbi:MAG TPA: trigger factor [Christensenellaceae bacterium]|nr:trigger factor [Christensenellaceae bacterium]
MAYTVEKISGNQVRFDFTVPAEEFEKALQQAYLKERKRISVPGFRKGRAPRKLIENMFGEGVFFETAFDIMFPKVYEEAVKAEGTKVVDSPSIDIEEIENGKDLEFSATVYVVPDVELGNYKGLKAVQYLPPVSDEDINRRIERDVETVTTRESVSDRAAEDGDYCNIDYKGTLDGVPFDGGTAEGQELQIGSGMFIPGFEPQLIGMNIGDEKDIVAIFPENYHAEDLKGKEAVFNVKLNAIQAEVRPELNDEFAQDVSEYETFDEYKEAIKKELEDIIKENSEVKVKEELLNQVMDASDCDIPQAMIDDEISQIVRQMQMQFAYQGIRFNDYLRYMGIDSREKLIDHYSPSATMNVKQALVLEAIVEKEAIVESEEELDEFMIEYAKQEGRELEELKKSLKEDTMEEIRSLIRKRKASDFIFENAKIKVKEEEEPQLNAQEMVKQVEEAIDEAEEQEEKEEKKEKKKKVEKKEEEEK